MADLLKVFKALSDETRLHLIKHLLQHDYCVGALAKRLNISDSAVSQHLKVLRKACIIKGEKRGYYTHYYVDRQVLQKAAKELSELSEIVRQADSDCLKTDAKHISCLMKQKCEHPELNPEDGMCDK